MVAIKDMDMPKDCKKCLLMGIDGKDILSPMMCIAIWATKHEIKHCVEGIILNDCPLVEIEERKVGKWIKSVKPSGLKGHECSECGSFYPLIEGLNYCPNCGSRNERV